MQCVNEKKGKLANQRLSEERVSRLPADNPEREKMMTLACKQGGMEVFVDVDFEANADNPLSVWPQLRQDYLEVHAAVDRSFCLSFLKKGLAMILTAETVRSRLGYTSEFSRFCDAVWQTARTSTDRRYYRVATEEDNTQRKQ